jgi:N-sulfoglucosamine sulfohydrolase
MIGLAHRGFRLNDYDTHLASYLNTRGYETVLCGFQHEAKEDGTIGYTKILSGDIPEGLDTEEEIRIWDSENAERAARFLLKSKKRPFFLSFGMRSTHRPFTKIDDDIDPDYFVPPFPVPDTRETRKDMAAYMTSIRFVDRCVGTVLESLEKSGKDKETLVLFTTDHGIPFPLMKAHLFDTGIGVSLIMSFPGNKMRGQAVDWLVSQIDLFPTICDIIGIRKPSWLQGRSLVPLFNGGRENVRSEIFAEMTFHSAYDPMRCIRTERYKYIRIFSSHDRIIHIGCDRGLSEQFMVRHGILDEIREKEMLFDLYLDPVERMNRVKDKRYRDVYEELSSRLQTWMKQTKDPLLHGDVTPPEGTVVDSPCHHNPNIKLE